MFASLEVLHKYELPLRDVPCNRNKLAETITETFHDAFVARWGGECMSPSELLNFISNLFAGFICEKLAKSELGYLNIKIGPQCVRVATAFLCALVCEYDVVEYVQLF